MILTLRDKKSWNQYLKKLHSNQQDVYYTPEYYSLYENYRDGNAQCFVFEKDGDIALYPFLLNSVNKLGYDLDDEYFDIQGAYGYNGIVSSNYDESFIYSFYSVFDEWCKKNNIVAEFTRFHPLINNYIFSENKLDVIKDRKTVFLDLNQDIDTIRASFSSSTKRAIKKASKNKLYLKVFENDFSLKDEFVALYNETMDRVGSIPYLFFNKEYFDSLFNLPSVIQFVVEYQNEVIASSVCFYSKYYFHYHLGASKKDFLNIRPNDFLFEEMIKYSKLKNCKYIHFGGGNTNSQEDGLYKFKKGFSRDTAKFYIGKKIHNQEVYNEVVKQWSEKYPEKYAKNKNKLLGYREIN